MRRFLRRLLPALLLAGLVGADEAPAPAERARLFERDRELIRELVEQGLRLAEEDDALKRADCCNGVARHLADEMRRAADDREPARVAELSAHLHDVLKGGVAANLTTACAGPAPAASTFEKDLQEVHHHTVTLLQPLEDELRRLPDGDGRDDVRQALQAVAQGRAEVEKAIRGRIKER